MGRITVWNYTGNFVSYNKYINKRGNWIGGRIYSMCNRKFVWSGKYSGSACYCYADICFCRRNTYVNKTLEKKRYNSFCSISTHRGNATTSEFVDDKNKTFADAFYTVEMSLLMPLLIGIITMMMYLGFYVNDRMVLEEAAKETAVFCASNFPDDIENINKIAGQKFNDNISRRLFSVNNISYTAQENNDCINVKVKADFIIPVFAQLRKELFGSDIKIEVEGQGVVTRPVRTIWKTKIIEKILDN